MSGSTTTRVLSRRARVAMVAVAAGLLAALYTFWLAGHQLRRPAPPPPRLVALPDFSLVERAGRTVSRADLAGAPWVADFIFTRCTGTCPRLTAEMKRLGDRLPAGVRRVSITVDPRHDTPEVLATYARTFGADEPDWLFLTGDPQAVEALVRGGFRVTLEAPGDDSPPAGEAVLHSTRLVLVDGEGGVRGYYDVFDPDELDRLVRDAGALAR